ncbi:holo-ACP synthase [Amphibacillus sediminis]|uniref:holo-ACP synthase n=1 Tax=Amphibacillus sediminis TaxID=360185 RepID=UPI0008363243|nr:holo-ACP synthase [Amphibacillus sediminis]
MIIGTGIDIVELNRIKQLLASQPRFSRKILTVKEQACFNDLPSDKRKLEFVAGRFAAKEAFAKAYGTGIGKLAFRDIEILPNPYGQPIINVHGLEHYRFFVSISHSDHYAVAQVIIEQ